MGERITITTPAGSFGAYYGGTTERYVEEGRDIDTPLLMHLAGSDEYMSAEAQQLIRDALAGNPDITIHTYPGRAHAFARRAVLSLMSCAAYPYTR